MVIFKVDIDIATNHKLCKLKMSIWCASFPILTYIKFLLIPVTMHEARFAIERLDIRAHNIWIGTFLDQKLHICY